MTHHLLCSLSQTLNCGKTAPQCADGCVGHTHSACLAVGRWRITTSSPDPQKFFQNYACDEHRDEVAKDAPDRVYEPVDEFTLFGFPIKESRAA